jgi:glycosyltransferase involved in cell wall biosynthesis
VNKVFLLPASEGWIVDRFVQEWNEDNADVSVKDPHEADVIWLLASWCWKHLPLQLLVSKKVITTVHHIVPEKFTSASLQDFLLRDRITTVYHVYNDVTKAFVQNLTRKPVKVLNYWANQKIWRPTSPKNELRRKYGLDEDSYVVGSFQRDTEGHDLVTPKLEKGPDLLANYLEKLNSERRDLHVVLAGWRRQYVANRLTEAGVRYSYFERPDQSTINELYQTLDLYPVTARCEGGPQAIIECGLLNIPVVSRDIGIAKQVLPADSISSDVSLATARVPNVASWKIPTGYEPYRKLIQEL